MDSSHWGMIIAIWINHTQWENDWRTDICHPEERKIGKQAYEGKKRVSEHLHCSRCYTHFTSFNSDGNLKQTYYHHFPFYPRIYNQFRFQVLIPTSVAIPLFIPRPSVKLFGGICKNLKANILETHLPRRSHLISRSGEVYTNAKLSIFKTKLFPCSCKPFPIVNYCLRCRALRCPFLLNSPTENDLIH